MRVSLLPSWLLLLLVLLVVLLRVGDAKVAAKRQLELAAGEEPHEEEEHEDNVCFVGTISGELHALNSHTGEVLWSTDLGGSRVRSFQSSEASSHGYIVPGEDGSLFTMIGGELYQYPFSIADFVEQSPLFHDNGLHTLSIFGSKYETIYQVDRSTGRVIGSIGFHSTPTATTETTAASMGAEEEDVARQTGSAYLTVIRHEYRVRAFDQITHRELWNLTFAEFTSVGGEEQKEMNEVLLQQAKLNWKSPVSMLSSAKSSNLVNHYYDSNSPPASLNHLVLDDGKVQWYVGRQRYNNEALMQTSGGSSNSLVPVFDADNKGGGSSTGHEEEGADILARPQLSVQRYAMGDFISQNGNITVLSLGQAMYASSASSLLVLKEYFSAAMAALAIASTLLALVVAWRLLITQPIAAISAVSPTPTPSSPASPTKNQPEETLARIKVFPERVKGYGANGTIVLEGEFENRPVAVKRMQRALCGSDTSAVKEINFLIQSEGHANVVRYFAREETPDFFFLALELCEMTLDQAMRESSAQIYNQAWIPDSTRNFLAQLASATRHLHQLGIVHCDIKAQNVLVCKQRTSLDKTQHYWQHWTPKLSDMGLSRRVETTQNNSQVSHSASRHAQGVASLNNTTNNVIGLGTVGWRAPELLGTNKTRISRSIDVFSLGCLFFYILHGTHPFGTDVLSLETCIVKGDAVELKRNPTVQPETRNLVSQMVAHVPDHRLSSNAVLHDAFLWNSKTRLEFLCLVSNRLEREDPNSPLMKSFEVLGERVFSTRSWVYHLELDVLRQDVLSNKKRKYDLNSLRDLLRYVRNKHHHFDEDPHLAKVLSGDAEEFLKVFTSSFPTLLPVLSTWAFATGVAMEDKFAPLFGGAKICLERSKHAEDEAKLYRDLIQLENGQSAEEEARALAMETERKWYDVNWTPNTESFPAPPPANNFKTNLCLHFEREQRCAMGTKCGFAHGRIELRSSEPLILPQNEQDLRKFRQATTPHTRPVARSSKRS